MFIDIFLENKTSSPLFFFFFVRTDNRSIDDVHTLNNISPPPPSLAAAIACSSVELDKVDLPLHLFLLFVCTRHIREEPSKKEKLLLLLFPADTSNHTSLQYETPLEGPKKKKKEKSPVKNKEPPVASSLPTNFIIKTVDRELIKVYTILVKHFVLLQPNFSVSR
ncbi:hypothetical protein OUZ56_031683 [Daphnia magna]|uniref:Uncharacterized protein n=1 Tax=Daphnia magna TaxID=35525 RepID=A0ABQ9ZUX4_9CRUS|nr:hypothetical protein OUZ56_031683 [Daphnia magna]